MLNLKFKIKNSKPNKSEIYLSDSYISQDAKNYDDIILEQIRAANLINDKNRNIKSAWLFLMDFINKNDFCFYKTLALKKRTPSLRKWLENNSRPLENICIIIHDKKLKINNSICFFIDIENINNSYDDYLLKRIEFFNWNLNLNNEEKINLNDLQYDEYHYQNYERELLFKYEMIFENEDYKSDPLYFNEWTSFLNHLNAHFYNKKDTNENDNFVVNIENNNILFSRYKMDLKRDKYILFNNEIGQEIKNEGYQFSNNHEINLIENLWTCINEFKVKIKQTDDANTELYKQIDIMEMDLQRLEISCRNYKEIIIDKNNEIKNFEIQIKALEKEEKNRFNEFNKQISQVKYDLEEQEKNLKITLIKIKNINDEIKDQYTNIEIYSNKKLELKKWISTYEEFINWCNESNVKYFYKLNISQIDNSDVVTFPKLVDGNWKIFSFKNNDYGTKAIINRFNNAFKNIEKGYYKNPFFYSSLKNASSSFNNVELRNQVDDSIKYKYKLNNKQNDAVNKAINTNSFFYLQGPPGTGKTQTISAIAEWLTKNQMNLIMTSSTHEAIENFFDRISESNYDNPNLVALKFRTSIKNEINDEKYSESKLFKIFKQRMINYYLPTSNDENNIEELLSNYIEEYGISTPDEYSHLLPKSIVEKIFSVDAKQNINFIEQFKSPNDPEVLMKPIFDRDKIDQALLKSLNEKIGKDEKLIKFNNLLNVFFEWVNLNNFNLNYVIFKLDDKLEYLKSIKGIIENISKSEVSSLNKILSSIRNKYTNHHGLDKYENIWLKHVVDNKLINIIGTTTTSKNEIRIADTDINLYSEYPIDYMIIDEISKCSMPEIFYRAILAKKIIFAGDYLQLPPSPNLDGESIINYLVESKYKEELHTIDNSASESDIDKKYKNWIANLYKKSFFSIQTENIKYNNKSSYEFLNEAHRFGKSILEIVNKIYPRDEQLILPHNSSQQSKKYNLVIGKNNYTNEVVLVNLKKCNRKFLNTHKDFIPLEHTFGFDQSGDSYKYIDKYKKIINVGAYNQYSAFVICDIIENLIEKNDLKKNKIAVITLTRNQKEMVNFYIKARNLNNNNIVVNTIDNFQGREEEIVIVDFIRGQTRIQDASKRSNSKRNIDFLNQKERINVALSRAKQKLIIVGFFEYLKDLEIENRLFQKYYEELCPAYNGSTNSYIDWSLENDEN